MRILLDHNVPWAVRTLLAADHAVETARYRGWDRLSNGKLLEAAAGQFDIVITIDRGIEHQQPVTQFPLAVVVLRPRRAVMRHIEPLMQEARKQFATMQAGRVYVFA